MGYKEEGFMGKKQLPYKIIMLGTLFAVCFMTLYGCKRKEEEKDNSTEEDEITVGFSMGTLMEDRWISDRDIFTAKAKEEGISVIFNNANNDSDLQYEQVQEMLKQDIDVLVIAPNDCYSEAKCVKAAKDKNIPVISYDRLVFDSNVDVYISFDHYKVGVTMATYLTEKAPEGGYIIVNGSKTDSNSQMIYDGAMSVLKPYIDDNKIQLLAETWVPGWIRETAYDFTTEQIKEHKDDIKAIICGNDSMAWGVIDALSEAQIAENVVVAGQDADLVACQRIVTGKQLVTCYKPIRKLVEKTVEVCKQLVNGEKIESQGITNDGTYDVPYIYIDIVGVTKENIDDTVIRDGFHLYEDVYQTNK
jgi:D-xylose transport system substrate-binding protein